MSRGQLWIWWLVVGVAATAGQYVLPVGSIAGNIVYDVIGAVSVVAIVLGLRVHRPARPAMWRWFAAGQASFVLGDVTWVIYENVLHLSPYPSLADVFYLASYPMFVVALLLLVRQRSSRLGDLIDGAIVATALALVFWIFVLRPVAADSGQTLIEHVVTIAYPVADVLLLVLLARLFTSGGARTASVHLLALGTTLMLVADTAFSVIPLYSEASTHPTDPIFLLSYVLWGVAALHPSMATAPAQSRVSAEVGRGRLLLFGVCSLLAPALLLVPDIGADRIAR